MKITIHPYLLHFKQPAGTSRGVYKTRQVWYLHAFDETTGYHGYGECAPLPNLSCDDIPNYEEVLRGFCKQVEETGRVDYEAMLNYPSMLFGLETALQQLKAKGGLQLWDTPFSEGKAGIPINGLIWMGNFDEMYQRIEEKMRLGFRCIKVKIGAIDFDKELELLGHIREHFGPDKIELRVDANGAFKPSDAPEKLKALHAFHLHSIEQPIRAGQWEEMAKLCATTPLPIAMDEELIGVNRTEDKIRLLETIRPQYIILKPSLHGGIQGSAEWIRLAKERNIGYWITSALESNIGLNAIAQWCATLEPTLPQGLGTGQLFVDNIDFPLHIQGDCLWFHPSALFIAPSTLSIDGKSYPSSSAKRPNATIASPLQELFTSTYGADSFQASLANFLAEWFDDNDTLKVHTSGSTGKPKELWVEKERMVNSAQATVSFLGLKEGDSALLCMPLPYIAGKMVVVRSLIAGLNLQLVTPCGHPLAAVNTIPDFAAMTPMQVFNTLEVPEEAERLKQVRHLIIGGGAVNAEMAAILKEFPHAVWSTYGMTETLSHIALRRLSGDEASDWYTPFEGVEISLSPENTLTIHAPKVCPEILHTNDIVTFNEKGQFRILGRKDNTINTGGIKVQIEEVETALHKEVSLPFMITSVPDAKFGEHIVLLVEWNACDKSEVNNQSDGSHKNVTEKTAKTETRIAIEQQISEAIAKLPTYWRPKDVHFISHLPLTGTGKPDRATAKKLAAEKA